MANDAQEEFWGCNLSKSSKEFLWNPTNDSEDDVEHKLQVTSACLGSKAKDGERNLVEFTTQTDEGKKITCSMVSLRAGGVECLHLELGFTNPTKFILKEGNGPVSLCGVHLQAIPLDFDEDSESDDDLPDYLEQNTPKITEIKTKNEIKSKEKSNPIKRPLVEEKNKDKKVEKPAAKKKKQEIVVESDDEDDEDEDEDEDEEEDEEMPSLLDGEAVEVSDEEDSEDEDEPEGDDVDDDEEENDDDEEDDDDDDDDEDESEEEKKASLKKINGHVKQTPGKQDKKQPQKDQKAQKTPGKQQNGKQEKKKVPVTPKSAGAKKTPEEIKGMLVKSPNLPKTFEKFSNYMKNNMKVIDEKSQKDFWEYVQKNRK